MDSIVSKWNDLGILNVRAVEKCCLLHCVTTPWMPAWQATCSEVKRLLHRTLPPVHACFVWLSIALCQAGQ